jgi:hypothetical protein
MHSRYVDQKNVFATSYSGSPTIAFSQSTTALILVPSASMLLDPKSGPQHVVPRRVLSFTVRGELSEATDRRDVRAADSQPHLMHRRDETGRVSSEILERRPRSPLADAVSMLAGDPPDPDDGWYGNGVRRLPRRVPTDPFRSRGLTG